MCNLLLSINSLGSVTALSTIMQNFNYSETGTEGITKTKNVKPWDMGLHLLTDKRETMEKQEIRKQRTCVRSGTGPSAYYLQ